MALPEELLTHILKELSCRNPASLKMVVSFLFAHLVARAAALDSACGSTSTKAATSTTKMSDAPAGTTGG